MHDTLSKVTLKRVEVSQVHVLASLLRFSFIEAYQEAHTMKDIQTYCEQHYTVDRLQTVVTDASYEVFFAIRAECEVGVLVIHHRRCPLRTAAKASELKQVYVRSSEYGTGLGAYLMDQTARLVRKAENDWLWLCVSDRNHRAQRFYQKMAFKRIGEGPVLEVGNDRLTSSILLRSLK